MLLRLSPRPYRQCGRDGHHLCEENKLATIVGEKTAGRLLSATSVKVGHGFRLALPTGAYYTWSGTALEGSPIEPDVVSDFDWKDRRRGNDRQLDTALKTVSAGV